MLGYVFTTLFHDVFGWVILAALFYLGFTAYKNRKLGEPWDERVAAHRKWAWIVVGALFLLYFNGAI